MYLTFPNKTNVNAQLSASFARISLSKYSMSLQSIGMLSQQQQYTAVEQVQSRVDPARQQPVRHRRLLSKRRNKKNSLTPHEPVVVSTPASNTTATIPQIRESALLRQVQPIFLPRRMYCIPHTKTSLIIGQFFYRYLTERRKHVRHMLTTSSTLQSTTYHIVIAASRSAAATALRPHTD